MSLTRKIAHNTLIQFSGKIISILLGVFTIALMARYLGQVGFGQYSTITAFLQIFASLVDMGLSITVVRLISDPHNDQQKIFNNLFSLRFFSALIFLGLAPLTVIFLPYDNLVKIGVTVTAISFFFSALNQIIIGLFQKELKMIVVTAAEVAGRVALLILVAVFAYYGFGLLSILLAVIIGSIINFAINYIFALKYVKITFAFEWQVWKRILRLTWPIAISIAFNLVYFKADTLILSLVRTQAEVGIYNAPYRVLEILVNFIFMFMGILLPVLTVNWAQKNYDKFKKIFQQAFDALIIISVPMVFGTMFVAEDLMVMIAGQEFIESGIILQILIFATAIIFINSLFGYTIVILDKQKQMVWIYILTAIIALAGYILTIPLYGYYGAAAFTIISEAMILFFNFIVVSKTIKYRPSLKIFFKSLIASLIMSGMLYLLTGQNVLLLLIVASLVYLISLYVLKGFDKKLLQDIIRLKSEPEQAKINGN